MNVTPTSTNSGLPGFVGPPVNAAGSGSFRESLQQATQSTGDDAHPAVQSREDSTQAQTHRTDDAAVTREKRPGKKNPNDDGNSKGVAAAVVPQQGPPPDLAAQVQPQAVAMRVKLPLDGVDGVAPVDASSPQGPLKMTNASAGAMAETDASDGSDGAPDLQTKLNPDRESAQQIGLRKQIGTEFASAVQHVAKPKLAVGPQSTEGSADATDNLAGNHADGTQSAQRNNQPSPEHETALGTAKSAQPDAIAPVLTAPAANAGQSYTGNGGSDPSGAKTRTVDGKQGRKNSSSDAAARAGERDDKADARFNSELAESSMRTNEPGTATMRHAAESGARSVSLHPAFGAAAEDGRNTATLTGPASHSSDKAGQPTASVSDPDGPDLSNVPMSGAINTARLTEQMRGSEMSLNLRSADLGSVAIRTAMSHEQLSAQISLEHGDVSRAIAADVPALQAKLSQEHGIQATIEVQQQGQSFSGGGQQPNHNTYRQQAANPAAMEAEPPEIAAQPLTINPTRNLTGRLDIRA